jgi:hypothetical protein
LDAPRRPRSSVRKGNDLYHSRLHPQSETDEFATDFTLPAIEADQRAL